MRGPRRSCMRSSKAAAVSSYRVGEHIEALEAKPREREKIVEELIPAMEIRGHDLAPI